MELNASSRLIEAAFVRRVIGQYDTKNGEEGLVIRQNITDGGRASYSYMGKWGAASGMDYPELYKSVMVTIKSRRGVKTVIPLPEHEPSAHVEPSRYEFHVEFLDSNGRTGKLDHEVKARNRFDAFTELLKGLKGSGGMEVVHRITCTEHK